MRGEEDLLCQIKATGVEDQRVLEALRQVPRAGFVPPELAGRADGWCSR